MRAMPSYILFLNISAAILLRYLEVEERIKALS